MALADVGFAGRAAFEVDAERETVEFGFRENIAAHCWRRLIDEAGFEVAGLYGWFDRRPFKGDEDMIWICRRRT